MACNVIRYSSGVNGNFQWGVVLDEVYPLAGSWSSTADFLANGGKEAAFNLAANPPAAGGSSLDSLSVLSPVTAPCQVICQGANYRQHMIDSGMNPEDKKFNMIFNKSAGCITGPYDDVVRPAHVNLLDYEVELGLVIGAPVMEARQIRKADLPSIIAGLVIANDVSARDVQVPEMQFFKGKSYRGFCPVGPVLCLLAPEDYDYLEKLDLKLMVNGQVRQSDSSGDMVFKPADTLSELSQIANLNVGDLIMTGTPAGCALSIPSPLVAKIGGLLPEATKWAMFKKMQGKKPNYLKPNDVMELTVRSADGRIDLGVQRNRIIQG